MPKKYSKSQVDEIAEFLLLQDRLPREIKKNRRLLTRSSAPEEQTRYPNGIAFSLERIEHVKVSWARSGEIWSDRNRCKGLVPISDGAVPPYAVVLTQSYIRLVNLSRQYPEFIRMPNCFDAHYERATRALIGLHMEDLPKELTLDTLVYNPLMYPEEAEA